MRLKASPSLGIVRSKGEDECAARTGIPLQLLAPGHCEIADARRFNQFIEAEVGRIPEQYLWIHRRFKGLTPDYPNYYGKAARNHAHEGSGASR